MVISKINAALFCAALLVTGCTPQYNQTITPGSMASTHTYVGEKAATLRGELTRLQEQTNQQRSQFEALRQQQIQESQQYHATIADLSARLQVGTTPGNPLLVQQLNVAQGQMASVAALAQQTSQLAAEVSSSSTTSSYLLESIRAARSLSGAVDEDHRQLRILEDDTNRTAIQIDRLMTELTSDVARQQQALNIERNNLNALSVSVTGGQLFGTSLSNRLNAVSAPVATLPASVQNSRPLVLIRFDRANVRYETALYRAIKTALDRRPNATFEVVSVAPVSAAQSAMGLTTAQRNAEAVVRSMTSMGLPPDRIQVTTTAGQVSVNEVKVFVR